MTSKNRLFSQPYDNLLAFGLSDLTRTHTADALTRLMVASDCRSHVELVRDTVGTEGYYAYIVLCKGHWRRLLAKAAAAKLLNFSRTSLPVDATP